jgi:hypothetical protein
MTKPSALAVLRLITNSNLVGCSTGMSAGFAPHNANMRNEPRSLGVCRERETERENDREPDQPHVHLGGGWLAGV